MNFRTRRIKLKKKSNRLEKTFTLYFIILIIISTINNLLINRNYYNVWTIGEWLINYEGGFVRRGLFGSIIYKLSYILNISPILLVQFLTILFFISFLYLLKDCRKYFSSLFLLSPIVSLSPLLGNYLVRKDVSGIVAYALCTNLIIKEKNFTNFLLINLICSISILNHESYFFYSVPSLCLLHYLSSKNLNSNNNFLKIYKTIIYIIPTLIISILVFYFNGNYEVAYKINQSWLNLSSIINIKQFINPFFPSGAIGSLSWTFNKGISLPLSIFNSFDGRGLIWIPAVWMLSIFICAQIFIGDKENLNRKIKTNVLLLQLTFISPLFILGWDFGRWIFLWISSSIFLTISLIRLESVNKNDLSNLDKICPKILTKLFVGFELNGFKKLIYLLISIPHCCWTIRNYLETLPIFFPFQIFLNNNY